MMITQVQRTLLSIAPGITMLMKHKGFWDQGENRNKGEMIMLTIGELGEAQEAHRKGKICKTGKVQIDLGVIAHEEDTPEYLNFFKQCYEEDVKGTVDEEIADVVIRVLDYVEGWNIRVVEREYRKESTGNFGEDLLRINWYLMLAYHAHTDETGQFPGKDFGYALAAICKFCEWWSIDLLQHVEWKMRYNSTREHKHGKAY